MSGRVRVFTPGPQGCEHSVKAVQSPTTQSTASGDGTGVGCIVGSGVGFGVGHASTSHASSSCKIAGQGTPPSLCSRVISRERAVTPGPQVALQAVQPVQSPSSQSTGQAMVLQSWVSVVAGQASPPCFGSVTVRIRDCVPPPQEALQAE
jgi:hypothetical protein